MADTRGVVVPSPLHSSNTVLIFRVNFKKWYEIDPCKYIEWKYQNSYTLVENILKILDYQSFLGRTYKLHGG